MAVAFVKNHTATGDKAASTTTFTIALDTAVPQGNLIVARMLYDNAATASKPLVSSIGRAAGETNTWATATGINSTSTSAGAFASGAMTYIRTSVSWPAGSYTVTLDTAVTQKAGFFQEFSGALATLRSTSAAAYSTTTTAAIATTTGTAPAVGDLVLGFFFGSNVAAAQAGDTDTLGNAWSAVAGFGTTGGNAATNNFGIGQYKIPNMSISQSYTPGATVTAGNGSIIIVLQSIVDPTITQASYRLYADGTETGSTALAAQDTSYALNADSGDVNLGVRVRLQSTNAGTLDPWDDYQLQFEKNASGAWLTVAAAGALADSFTTGTFSSLLTSAVNAIGQSTIGLGNPLTQLQFLLFRTGSPTGNLFATIYAHSGTYGSGGAPTGTALATSTTTIAQSTVSTSDTWTAFNFDGTFTMANGTPYFVVIEQDVGTNTPSNCIGVRFLTGTGGHAGNMASRNGTTWGGSTSDCQFQLFVLGEVAAYNSANLTDAAATTNRLGAGTGSFSAGKVSEDGLVDDLGWTANNYTELLYSVTVKAANVVNADTLRFRVLRNGATTGFTYTQTPTVTVTKSAPPAITQDAYRFYAAGSETGGAALGTQDTPYTANLTAGNLQIPLRMRLQSTSADAPGATDDYQLQYEKNTSGTWVNISSGSTNVISYLSAALSDGGPTTNRLTGGTGTFVAGKVSEDGLADDMGWTGNNFTEVLYAITIVAADVVNTDTLRFRVLRNGVTTTLTYTATPTITITKATPLPPLVMRPMPRGSANMIANVY